MTTQAFLAKKPITIGNLTLTFDGSMWNSGDGRVECLTDEMLSAWLHREGMIDTRLQARMAEERRGAA